MITSILGYGTLGIIGLILGGIILILCIMVILAIIGLIFHASSGVFAILIWCIRPAIKVILFILAIILVLGFVF